MFPGVDGFRWDAGHVVFLGAFFGVLLVVLTTLLRIGLRSLRDAMPARVERLRWRADFSDLPGARRRCRHELTGEIASRACPNEFDCRGCDRHPDFVAKQPAGDLGDGVREIAGLRIPLDRYYHRGHAWAKPQADGTWTIGLDELARAAIGYPDLVELPAPGTHIAVNTPAWSERKSGDRLRVLSPVDAEVVETDGGNNGWRLRVKLDPGFRPTHLLAGADAVAWFRAEFDRLQRALGDPALGTALADGGVLADDLEAACPGADWQAARGLLLLEP
jgi:hypothetical protein